VFAQPGDQRIGRRVLEQVNDLMGVSVDQNGPEAAPATESELVDPKAARRSKRRLWKCPDQAQPSCGWSASSALRAADSQVDRPTRVRWLQDQYAAVECAERSVQLI
jgi:hypothetical protein